MTEEKVKEVEMMVAIGKENIMDCSQPQKKNPDTIATNFKLPPTTTVTKLSSSKKRTVNSSSLATFEGVTVKRTRVQSKLSACATLSQPSPSKKDASTQTVSKKDAWTQTVSKKDASTQTVSKKDASTQTVSKKDAWTQTTSTRNLLSLGKLEPL